MNGTISRTLGAYEATLLVTLGLAWGATFFFIEIALAELGWATVVAARLGLAAVAMLALVWACGYRMPGSVRAWGAFAVMAALNNVLPFNLIAWGQLEITGGLSAVLVGTTPVFTVLVAHVATADERATRGRLAGVGLGLAGVAVMIGPDALAGLGREAAAQSAVVLAAFIYALAGVYGRRFHGAPPLVAATGQVAAAAVMTLPIALVVDRPWTLALPGGLTLTAIAFIALAGTALAYVLYFRILATAGATNLLLVTFVTPVGAILLGAAFLGETLSALQLLGMALIALGLAAIDGRALRLVRRRGG